MKKAKYPKYKLHWWLDTSPESFAKDEPDVFYGVQILTEKGGRYRHCHSNGKPLLYKTRGDAQVVLQYLRGQVT